MQSNKLLLSNLVSSAVVKVSGTTVDSGSGPGYYYKLSPDGHYPSVKLARSEIIIEDIYTSSYHTEYSGIDIAYTGDSETPVYCHALNTKQTPDKQETWLFSDPEQSSLRNSKTADVLNENNLLVQSEGAENELILEVGYCSLTTLKLTVNNETNSNDTLEYTPGFTKVVVPKESSTINLLVTLPGWIGRCYLNPGTPNYEFRAIKGGIVKEGGFLSQTQTQKYYLQSQIGGPDAP